MKTLIDRYESDGELLGQAIAGLSRDELTSFPIPGTWSIQEVILHLLDSDLISADRIKRVIAEPSPTLLAYDETLFAKHLNYQQLDAELACDMFRLNRKMMAKILRLIPDEAWLRTGNHTERGVESLKQILDIYIGHLHHHLRFVSEKRKVLG